MQCNESRCGTPPRQACFGLFLPLGERWVILDRRRTALLYLSVSGDEV